MPQAPVSVSKAPVAPKVASSAPDPFANEEENDVVPQAPVAVPQAPVAVPQAPVAVPQAPVAVPIMSVEPPVKELSRHSIQRPRRVMITEPIKQPVSDPPVPITTSVATTPLRRPLRIMSSSTPTDSVKPLEPVSISATPVVPLEPVSISATPVAPLEPVSISAAPVAPLEPVSISATPVAPVARVLSRRPRRIVQDSIAKDVSSIQPVFPERVNGSLVALTDQELLEQWDRVSDFSERDNILAELQRRDLFPSQAITRWEQETGAYPDIMDPEFLQKLLSKREFAESLQTTWKPRSAPCEDQTSFEVTPVQRFISNFMSPKTPYMSALLYHGVGVGKTCAAVQIMEAWLEYFPYQQVILIAPPTIQQGFFRTIFDISKVIIGHGNEPNSASQCTGITYLKLTNMLYERNLATIEKAVNKMIKRRVKVFAYISFANYIRSLIKGAPGKSDEQNELYKKRAIRNAFSGKLLIIDEAHNLRDIAEDADEALLEVGGKAEKGDAAGGKLLTPFLRDVLMYSEGMKFCALTATPMYNSYREIIFMLNLLLMNDKKATLTETDLFDRDGNLLEKGASRLSFISQRYVSFMRGENPLSFPVRLFPEQITRLNAYPLLNPRRNPIEEEDRAYYQHLPLVPVPLQGHALQASRIFMDALGQGAGLNTIDLQRLVHAGNIVFPATESTQGETYDAYSRRTDALLTVFDREMAGGEVRYRAKPSTPATWLAIGELASYSPKFDMLLRRIQTAEGCIFLYTRFVSGGALPLCLALEANGYTPYGRKHSLLMDGIQALGGRQCAACSRKEKDHVGSSHAFSPAYYGVLTGDITLSPHNEETIIAQRSFDNATGKIMKVIIGSQIASEGVDLRFIRETHLIDSWYHLNKTEQILGRAIRYLSHCALPQEKRNNPVYLYVATLPPNDDRETADLYSYRMGFKKAVLIGRVTRVMKQSAMDCNLNHDAILIKGQPSMREVDAQGLIREEVNINDMPFTAVCDWIETCDYTCRPQIDIRRIDIDDSSYDEYSARWRIHQLKDLIRKLFERQTFYATEDIWDLFKEINRDVVVGFLQEIVNNKTFQIRHKDQYGYIRYCNGYYVFQPNVYTDMMIPLAVRSASFPVKRDMYVPAPPYEQQVMPVNVDEELNERDPVINLWNALVSWIHDLSRQTQHIDPPAELERRRMTIARGDAEILERYVYLVEMIYWFHASFHSSPQRDAHAFEQALLSYVWDEWLSLEEQKEIAFVGKQPRMIEHDDYAFGRLMVHRMMDPSTGTLQYLCDEKQCVTSIVEEIEKDKTDAIRAFPVHRRSTGEFYGFVVSKNGNMVFKTASPPDTGKKVERGLECGNVSTMTRHVAKLIQLGDILRKEIQYDMDLNGNMIRSERVIQNSTRACTLLDLMLRYMDAARIQGKRWFFRPVQAFYIGHVSSFRRMSSKKGGAIDLSM